MEWLQHNIIPFDKRTKDKGIQKKYITFEFGETDKQNLLEFCDGSIDGMYIVFCSALLYLQYLYTQTSVVKMNFVTEYINGYASLEMNLSYDITLKSILERVQNAMMEAKIEPATNAESLLVGLGCVPEIEAHLAVSLFIEKDVGSSICVQYDANVYDLQTVSHYICQTLLLVANITKGKTQVLSELCQFSEDYHLIETFNETDKALPVDLLLHSRMEYWANKTPNRIAVRTNNSSITYGELSILSSKFAYTLKKKGIKINDIVAIMTDRSIEMMVGVFAALKLGAAYLPIRLDTPVSRINHMLKDSEAVCLLTIHKVQVIGIDCSSILYLDDDKYYNNTDDYKLPDITGEQAAYVLYTSGSTGNPKGVIIEHKSVVNRIQWMQDVYNLTAEDVIMQKTSYTFDVSVWELFWWSFAGASVYLLEPGSEKNPEPIMNAIYKQRVTVMHFVPTMLEAFLNYTSVNPVATTSLRMVFSSGETLKPEMVDLFYQCFKQTLLVNLYGPTEASIDVTYYDCHKNDARMCVPIGKPIANTKIYILNGETQLPVGAWGELCIAGANLARGYLKQRKLTAERFQVHPVLGRIYRTGDVARWTVHGEIEFRGRLDRQVKYHGYRIELEEIELAIKMVPEVVMATVIFRENSEQGQRLVAFYVTDSGKELEYGILRKYMLERIPEYMLPHSFYHLKALPITPHGKLDTKCLLRMADQAVPSMIENGESDMHSLVGGICNALLQGRFLTDNDNLFTCGLDSISAIVLVNELNSALNREVTLTDVYDNPTVEGLCKCIESIQAKGSMDISIGQEHINKLHKAVLEDVEQCQLLPTGYEDFYPLSRIQESMVFYSKIRPEEPIYRDQFIYDVVFKEFDENILKKALNIVVQRHNMLRTGFNFVDFVEPIQIVYNVIDLPINIENITMLSKPQKMDKLNMFLEKDKQVPYYFHNEILWRLKVFHLLGDRYLFVLSFHHALLDGWSVAYFVKELVEIYEKLKSSIPVVSLALKSSYKDYIAIQLSQQSSKRAKEFWCAYLAGYIRNKLPFNWAGKRLRKTKQNKIKIHDMDGQLYSDIKLFCKLNNFTVKDVCIAAYVYLLHIITGESDVVAGVVTNDRPVLPDSEKIVGCFLNTVPLRMNVDDKIDKIRLIETISTHMEQIKKNELFLSDIAKEIGQTSTQDNPIFDVIMNFVDFYVLDDIEYTGQVKELYNQLDLNANEMTNTYLDFEVSCTLNKFSVRIKYSMDYFYDEDIVTALELYNQILLAFSNKEIKVLDSGILIKENYKQYLLHEWNNTEYDYPDITVHNLFERQALKTPDNIAVLAKGKNITYRQLNLKANQIARFMLGLGVVSSSRVAIYEDRDIDMVACMFATLKIDCTYVPISKEYGADRIKQIMDLAGCGLLFTTSKLIIDGITTIEISDEKVDIFSGENVDIPSNMNSLAYIIFTSGSTGIPKGVMIENRSVTNLVSWMNENFSVGAQDSVLCVSSICFDLSVYDIFGLLSVGGKVFLAQQEQVRNPNALAEIISSEGITIWNSVPSTMSGFVEYVKNSGETRRFEHLRLLLLSGDWIPVNLYNSAMAFFPKAQWVSLGGATEGTVWSIWHTITDDDKVIIPYGKPIGNNKFYILDNNQKLVPAGVPGELYIGGVGVAKGYIGDRERSNSSFLPDGFSCSENGAKMYRTGDWGKMLPTGEIEFLGRKDYQVKVRGYRIELGEIEYALLQHTDIIFAAAVDKQDNMGNKYIAAYYVSNSDIKANELKDFCKRYLPTYMLPDRIVALESVPLNTNNKVDKNKLRNITDEIVSTTVYEPPSDTIEKELEVLWKEILVLDKIGVNDSFFDLGGNSLLLMKLVSRIEAHFCKKLEIADFFRYSTIRSSAKLIGTEVKSISRIQGTMCKSAFIQALSTQNARGLLELEWDATILKLLDMVTNKIEMPVETILLAASIYTIGYVTEADKVRIYFTEGTQDILELCIDMEEVTTYQELLASTHMAQLNAVTMDKNMLTAQPFVGEVYALLKTDSKPEKLANHFDILFQIVLPKAESLMLRYNAKRLGEQQATELINVFMSFIFGLNNDSK